MNVNRLNKSRKLQRATAIVAAILIVSVVSIAAITMQGYLRGEINQTNMMLDSDLMYNNLLSAEAWGVETVKKLQQQSNDEKIRTELNLKNYLVNIKSRIIDQSGLFNINYLYSKDICRQGDLEQADKVLGKIFVNLLLYANPNTDLTLDDAENITSKIRRWMCPRNNRSDEYASDASDENNRPAWEYQPSQQFFVDTSELRLISKIDNKIYYNIKSGVTALPIIAEGGSKLFNINSMSDLLFAAIAGVELDVAKQFLKELKNKNDQVQDVLTDVINYITNQKAYSEKELKELKKMLYSSNNSNSGNTKDTKTSKNQQSSRYYIIQSLAERQDYQMEMNTLVDTDDNVNVIWRRRGG